VCISIIWFVHRLLLLSCYVVRVTAVLISHKLCVRQLQLWSYGNRLHSWVSLLSFLLWCMQVSDSISEGQDFKKPFVYLIGIESWPSLVDWYESVSATQCDTDVRSSNLEVCSIKLSTLNQIVTSTIHRSTSAISQTSKTNHVRHNWWHQQRPADLLQCAVTFI